MYQALTCLLKRLKCFNEFLINGIKMSFYARHSTACASNRVVQILCLGERSLDNIYLIIQVD